MKALVLVDIQNDFLPGGALAVPQGDMIMPLANQVQREFKLIVATQDWHPANHLSFAANHPGKKPGDIIPLNGQKQVLWPVHCVQNTFGAKFAGGLRFDRVNKVFRKGTDAAIDSYSGFFDNGHIRATGLGEYLKEKKVTDLFVIGLATDYCVKFTALDAVALGFRTYVIEDACRGVNLTPGDVNKAIGAMKAAGIQIMKAKDLAPKSTAA
jgi:nicotinamidase/pyrazinamidase